jgi:hypothetical protein
MIITTTKAGGNSYTRLYVGQSKENRETEIKIRNIAPLSYKLADMYPIGGSIL